MRSPEEAVARAVVALARGLRAAGVPAGIDEELTLCRALAEVDVRRREDVYWAGRASLLRRIDDLATFEAVFERWWGGQRLEAVGAPIAEQSESDPRMPGPQHGGESLPQFRHEGRSGHILDGKAMPALRPLELPSSADEQPGEEERRGVLAAYSPNEVLTEREPLGLGADEAATVRRLAEALKMAAPQRASRRLRPAGSVGRLDVRRTVRGSLATDGEAIRIARSSRTLRPRRLLFICDVSGSMERHSRVLLASLQGVVGADIKAETFVFATRLTRLTTTLGSADVAGALDRARSAVEDWSGGTRIGEVLAGFNAEWGRRGLARGAIAIVVSDGWDRGDPELLSRELERLQRQSRRLVWLNPRPADLGGQPLAVGMRAALPYIDDYIAGHDPHAVGQLVRLVHGLGAGRAVRRQRPSSTTSSQQRR